MQAEGPYASGKGMRNLQQAQSTSRRSIDVEASCENHMGSRVRHQSHPESLVGCHPRCCLALEMCTYPISLATSAGALSD